MLVKNYKIDFVNYWVIESKFRFHPHQNLTPLQVSDIPLDIDFDILQAEGQKRFKIILVVQTATKNIESPYDFYVKAESIFSIKEELDYKQENDILLRTALPLCISSTRSYISNNSAYSPLKRYMLPVIDIDVLIKEKIKQIMSSNKDKKSIPSKKHILRIKK